MLLLSKRYNGYCKLLKTLGCNNKLYVIYKMQRLRTFMEISNQKDKEKLEVAGKNWKHGKE